MPYKTISHHILLVDDNTLDVDLFERAIRKTTSNIKLEMARDGDGGPCLSQAKYGSRRSPADCYPARSEDAKSERPGSDLRIEITPTIQNNPDRGADFLNEVANVQQAYDLGANSYIMKSVDYDEFARAVTLIHHYWCQLNIYPE